MRMCVFVNWWFNHLGVLKHAQVRVHAQGFGFMAGAFVKLCCLVEFPLVGIDVSQEQLIVVLAPFLPLLQISQHKHWHVWRDKHSHACARKHTNACRLICRVEQHLMLFFSCMCADQSRESHSWWRFLPCFGLLHVKSVPVYNLAIKCMMITIIVIGPVSARPCLAVVMLLVGAETSKQWDESLASECIKGCFSSFLKCPHYLNAID